MRGSPAQDTPPVNAVRFTKSKPQNVYMFARNYESDGDLSRFFKTWVAITDSDDTIYALGNYRN